MKQFLALILFCTALTSCMRSITGSGNVISTNRDTGPFTKVSASGGLKVDITIGDERKVTVETDDNVQKYVHTEIKGNTLRISTENNLRLTDTEMRVHVTMPSVEAVSASASARVFSKQTISNGSALDLNASSGANIDLELDAPKVDLDASSGANLTAKGRAREVSANSSSGASLNAGGLKAEKATATSSSGASMHIFASVDLNADASSGASINYSGGAKVKSSQSSGGSVSGN